MNLIYFKKPLIQYQEANNFEIKVRSIFPDILYCCYWFGKVGLTRWNISFRKAFKNSFELVSLCIVLAERVIEIFKDLHKKSDVYSRRRKFNRAVNKKFIPLKEDQTVAWRKSDTPSRYPVHPVPSVPFLRRDH